MGRQTIKFDTPPEIIETAATGGVKEGEGPLRDYFDMILKDDKCGQDSWELAESTMQRETCLAALSKAQLAPKDIDYILAGDLQNQCTASHYSIRELKIPFFGLYGACSTMTESISLGAVLVASGGAQRVMCATSSHYCSAERQFRYPLEYGGQRPPSAQWTVTGAGSLIIGKSGGRALITHITTGRIIDKGITDANNMGAAMAPAACDTLCAHFKDTGIRPDDYDLILTGDLGLIGSDILAEMLLDEGYDIKSNHNDCGKLIYSIDEQDVHSGGSGCGCMGSVFCSAIYKGLLENEYENILIMATGALMNTQSVQQGESIPAIAHAVSIRRK